MMITLKECCAICEFYKNHREIRKCPLEKVYSTASECGCDDADEFAKYRVTCDAFKLNKLFNTDSKNGKST